MNILELLQPENEEVRFYIVDRYVLFLVFSFVCLFVGLTFPPPHSHRPLELDNVYNQDQVSNNIVPLSV